MQETLILKVWHYNFFSRIQAKTNCREIYLKVSVLFSYFSASIIFPRHRIYYPLLIHLTAFRCHSLKGLPQIQEISRRIPLLLEFLASGLTMRSPGGIPRVRPTATEGGGDHPKCQPSILFVATAKKSASFTRLNDASFPGNQDSF